MKVLAYCWSCNKEHNVTNLDGRQYDIKCNCGGYVITPSGKVNLRLVPENENDRELLYGQKIIE